MHDLIELALAVAVSVGMVAGVSAAVGLGSALLGRVLDALDFDAHDRLGDGQE